MVHRGNKDIAVGKTLCILVDTEEDIKTYFTEKKTSKPDEIGNSDILYRPNIRQLTLIRRI